MKLSQVLILSGLMMIAGMSASRASVYSFDLKSDDISGTVADGTLTADNLSFDITGIAGTVNGTAISGLGPALLSLFFIGFPENKLAYVSSMLFLTDFSFTDTNGAFYEIGNFPLPFLPKPEAYALDAEGGSLGTLSLSAVSAVPLPASLPLFGVGMLALATAGFGQRKLKPALASNRDCHRHSSTVSG